MSEKPKTLEEILGGPLTPGLSVMHADRFDRIATQLELTALENRDTVLSADLIFENQRIVSAMGSIELIARALQEGMTVIAPMLHPGAYLRISLQHCGYRS